MELNYEKSKMLTYEIVIHSIYIISEYTNCKTKKILRCVNKYLYKNIKLIKIVIENQGELTKETVINYIDIQILKSLNMYNDKITDNMIKRMKNLEILCLSSNREITDNGIKNLKNLQELTMKINENITDDGIKELKNLEILSLPSNIYITDNGIKNLIKLEDICLGRSIKNITDEGIKKLKKLIKINIWVKNNYYEHITSKRISNLKKLEELVCRGNKNITDETIKELKKLKTLYVNDSQITDNGIRELKNLKILYIESSVVSDRGVAITDNGIKDLDLHTLDIRLLDHHNNQLSNNGIKNMKNLKNLYLSDYCKITGEGFDSNDLLELSLGHIDINEKNLINFSNLNKLDYTCGRGLSNETIQKLPSLEILLINGSNITYGGIYNKIKLKILSINGCDIRNEGIKNLINLEKLEISKYITDEGLKKLEKLKYLSMEYNYKNITRRSLNKLKKLEIVVDRFPQKKINKKNVNFKIIY